MLATFRLLYGPPGKFDIPNTGVSFGKAIQWAREWSCAEVSSIAEVGFEGETKAQI